MGKKSAAPSRIAAQVDGLFLLNQGAYCRVVTAAAAAVCLLGLTVIANRTGDDDNSMSKCCGLNMNEYINDGAKRLSLSGVRKLELDFYCIISWLLSKSNCCYYINLTTS